MATQRIIVGDCRNVLAARFSRLPEPVRLGRGSEAASVDDPPTEAIPREFVEREGER